MGLKQNKIGSICEKLLCEFLRKEGFWCHRIVKSDSGQPFDVIALKNNIGYCIDVKHCSTSNFPFERVEPNQWSSMQYALNKGNSNVGFALYSEENKEWYWLPFTTLNIYKNKDERSIDCYRELLTLKEYLKV